MKKQKSDKEKKQGENTGKKEDTPKPSNSKERRTASEEKRLRDLSKLQRNSSPSLMHNSCVQVRTMGNYLSGTHSDSDEESYDTPPESLDTESDPEYDNDDPNAPELSEDDITQDEDIDELLTD